MTNYVLKNNIGESQVVLDEKIIKINNQLCYCRSFHEVVTSSVQGGKIVQSIVSELDPVNPTAINMASQMTLE